MVFEDFETGNIFLSFLRATAVENKSLGSKVLLHMGLLPRAFLHDTWTKKHESFFPWVFSWFSLDDICFSAVFSKGFLFEA